MTSRLKILKQRAIRREVYPFTHNGEFLVFAEKDRLLGPTGPYTKRQAIHMAYSISISKQHKLEVWITDANGVETKVQ